MKSLTTFLSLLLLPERCFGGLLIPYGICQGDSKFDVGDDTLTKYALNEPFRFYGTNYRTLYLASNGYIIFTPNQIFTLTFSITDQPAIIAPFFTDLVDRGFGLFIRESKKDPDLAMATNYVRLLYQQLATFEATSLVVVTWDRFRLFNQFGAIGTHAGDGINFLESCAYGNVFAIALDDTSQVPCIPFGVNGIIVETGQPTTLICLPVFLSGFGDCPVHPEPGRPEQFMDNCGNCTVSNGLGYNSFTNDCTAFWTCVLKESVKMRPNTDNAWVSYKRVCPCDMVWSQKTLTCVDFRSKLSDCSRGDPSLNPCFGLPAGLVLPRKNPTSVLNEHLCSGYIRCVQVGDQVLPQPQCCPPGECFIPDNSLSIPCTEGCCIDKCDGVDDCDCITEIAPKKECMFQAVIGDSTKFMGKETMHTYVCSAGTCWDDEQCTCVRANNNGFADCIPWIVLDFEEGDVKSVSGLGHHKWLERSGIHVVPNGALATMFFGRFSGNGDFVNLAALSNAYIGNTFVIRLYFRLETNDGVPTTDEEQIILTNCFDQRGTTQEDPTVDVCVLRQGGTGTGTQLRSKIVYNNRMFMFDDSMDTTTIDIVASLQVHVWYEFWLIYCGDEEIVFSAVLDESGTVLDADSANIMYSKFIVVTQSGFVFGSSVEASKRDFDGGIDEVLMYRCKPDGDPDFDSDFAAIKTFIN